TFALAPSQLALDPADEVLLDVGGRTHRLRLTQVDDAGARRIEAVATDPSIYEAIVGPQRAPGGTQGLSFTGRARWVSPAPPLLPGTETPGAPHAAAFASPWPGSVLVLKSASDEGFTLDTTLPRAAAIGETTADFASGPPWRWDEANALRIRLYNG